MFSGLVLILCTGIFIGYAMVLARDVLDDVQASRLGMSTIAAGVLSVCSFSAAVFFLHSLALLLKVN